MRGEKSIACAVNELLSDFSLGKLEIYEMSQTYLFWFSPNPSLFPIYELSQEKSGKDVISNEVAI